MIRKDREMPREFAESIVDKCEWAVMAMTDADGFPYCIPLTIARDGNFIYFHAGKAIGKKAAALAADSRICMTCVGDTKRASDKFTTEFESAVLTGTASEVEDEQEKIHALRLICERHTPANMAEFQQAMERSLSNTAVWKITIGEMTGKRKKYDKDGTELKYGRME